MRAGFFWRVAAGIAGAFAVALAAAGPAAAEGHDIPPNRDSTTGNNSGAGTGNSVSPVVHAPLTACGTYAGVSGDASMSCRGSAASASAAGGSAWSTGWNGGVANGNQVAPMVETPVDVCGNAIAVSGYAGTNCSGGAE